MYQNIANTTIADLVASGSEIRQAETIVLRVTREEIASIRKVNPQSAVEVARRWEEAAAVGQAGDFSEAEKGMLTRIRAKVPGYNDASDKFIAMAFAQDARDLAQIATAIKENRFVMLTDGDGIVQQGIVSKGPNGELLREGTWVALAQDGKRRQIAEFQEGQLHGYSRVFAEAGHVESGGKFQHGKPIGTHLRYDERGQSVHRAYYENGNLIKEETIDPEKERIRRGAMALQRSMTIG